MSKFIDLSHFFEDQMPGYKMKRADGSVFQFTAHIRPFLTHKQSEPNYQGKSSFEITEISFQTSVGTYLDSPYHRYPDGRDISEIELNEVILDGVIIDVRGRKDLEPVSQDILPENIDISQKAVLFNFGWDKFWGDAKYEAYPFISKELIEYLLNAGVKLVGVDTLNIDDSRDPSRPAHSLLLKHNILIVENLTNLHLLHEKSFRFFAVPLKAKKTAAIPVRAMAEIL